MDLDFTEEQEMLRHTARSICEDHCGTDMVRAIENDARGYLQPLWRQLADAGLLAMRLPEQYGGSGLGLLDSVVVHEELGRALAPTPCFVSAVLSADAIQRAGSEAQRQQWLPAIGAGERIVTPAWLEPEGGFGPAGVQLTAKPAGSGYRLDGVKRHVAFASAAHRLMVLARTGGGGEDIGLFLVDPRSPGVQMEQQFSLASDNQYRVSFSNVAVGPDDCLGALDQGWQTWNAVMHEGIVLAAATAVGGAERALEITVGYAQEREQFGKPIGAFQAIAHYLADASTTIDGAKTLVYEAAWARDAGQPFEALAVMAKLFACDTYRDVTATAEQVHGGIGFILEYDIQLFFRRAKQLQISWWDTAYLEKLLATYTLDEGRPVAVADPI